MPAAGVAAAPAPSTGEVEGGGGAEVEEGEDGDIRRERSDDFNGDEVPVAADVAVLLAGVGGIGGKDSVDVVFDVEVERDNPCLNLSLTQSLLLTLEATSPNRPSFASPST